MIIPYIHNMGWFGVGMWGRLEDWNEGLGTVG